MGSIGGCGRADLGVSIFGGEITILRNEVISGSILNLTSPPCPDSTSINFTHIAFTSAVDFTHKYSKMWNPFSC